jgi:hypothetical protein
LQSALKPTFFPFSIIAAVFYGVQVDIYSWLFHAKSNGNASAKRMVASLGIASTTTGVLAAYFSIMLGLVPYTQSLFMVVYIPIVIWGVLSGAVGGAISARLWDKNLKARFGNLVSAEVSQKV